MAQKQKELLSKIKITVKEWREQKEVDWNCMNIIMNLINSYEEENGEIWIPKK